MGQPHKHWIQGILGDDPFLPVPYFYDVELVVLADARHVRERRADRADLPSGVADDARSSEPPLGDRAADGQRRCTRSPPTRWPGIGLAIDLLDTGATVYRATQRRSTSAAAASRLGHGARRRCSTVNAR